MTAIGLDVGTGFVKCVSDTKKIKFPSLYAYRKLALWEGRNRIVEAVGDDTVELAGYPNTRVVRPVVLGRPIHEKGFEKLVKKAVDLVSETNDAMGQQVELSKTCIVIGLPYDAKPHAENIQKMVTRLFKPKRCNVVAQVLGTLVDMNLSEAIVVSIGHGTTEVVAFKNYAPIRGTSIHHAVSEISTELGIGKTAYLDHDMFAKPEVKPLIVMLADALLDDLNWIRQDLEHLPIVVSGGGIMIPGMKDIIESKLSHKVLVPQDPVMSNALGLFKLASQEC
ncbi:MAG: ParM/StbA family protein [Nitrosotalea sp.]